MFSQFKCHQPRFMSIKLKWLTSTFLLEGMHMIINTKISSETGLIYSDIWLRGRYSLFINLWSSTSSSSFEVWTPFRERKEDDVNRHHPCCQFFFQKKNDSLAYLVFFSFSLYNSMIIEMFLSFLFWMWHLFIFHPP